MTFAQIRIATILCGLVGIYSQASLAQPETISHSVVMLGNTGDIKGPLSYGRALSMLLDTMVQDQTIVFNGDVITKERQEYNLYATRELIQRLRMPGKRKIVVMPGDRDWDDSGRRGWNMVQGIERELEELTEASDVIWPLRGGCPGPERVQIDLTINLIAINTQWWNHPYDKPSPATTECKIATRGEFVDALKEEIEDAGYGNLIIAGHYPVISNGIYGGSFPVGRWLLPVPIVSTMTTAHLQNVGGPREIVNKEYETLREELEDILKEQESMIYASGHEPNLEILKDHGNFLVNSGAPEKGGYVSKTRETLFSSRQPGLVVLHYDILGNIWADTYEYRKGEFHRTELKQLMGSPFDAPGPAMHVNERMIPWLNDNHVLTRMEFEHPDSVLVVPNQAYDISKFRRNFLGEHYRESWTSAVKVPTLDLDTIAGGLRPYEVGGSRQTISLKFVGEDGYAYVFRSVDKDPSRSLDIDWRNTIISLLVRDQTTTQHPFGAVPVSSLLDSLDILHATPQLYVIPDDPKLGPFRSRYGGLLGMLEEFPTGNKAVNRTFADATRIERTVRMYRELFETPKHKIDSREFTRSRIFDILVGDWGRHEDNWKWAGYKDSVSTVYRPIPRDRDHVFSLWDGMLPWIVDRKWAKQSGENFGYKIKDMRSLNWQARHMDRFLLSEVDLEAWKEEARFIQERLTDEVIDQAMERMPDGSDFQHTEDIRSKLKVRRDDLEKYIERYYSDIAKYVDVVGTIKRELYDVERLPDGKVRVDVYSIKQDQRDKLRYSRTFDPEYTREIRLFSVLGDDSISIHGSSRESILVRVIPGLGNDVVVDRSYVRKGGPQTQVYSKDANDSIRGGQELHLVDIPHSDAYQYDMTAFKYNRHQPMGYISYSPDDGFQITGGVRFIRHHYNKPDFSAIHNVSLKASTLGNLDFRYTGVLRHVFWDWDFLMRTEFSKNRRFNYFFGLGNETKYDLDSLRNGYYTLRNSMIFGEFGAQKLFWKRSRLAFNLNLSRNSGESGEDNIFEGELPDDLGGATLQIITFKGLLNLDFRDNIILPTQGMRTLIETSYSQLVNEDGSYGLFKGVLEWYGTARPFTLGLRGGGWVHHGTPPFYHLEYLGQNTYLRGYRRNRFVGKKALFLNTDLRIQILENDNVGVPHKAGLVFFYDIGRVFLPGEESNKWHMGYGVGFYFVPFSEKLTLALSLQFSEEESTLFRFRFGRVF